MLLRVHVETTFGSTCFDYHSDVVPSVGEMITLSDFSLVRDLDKFKSTHNKVTWVSHVVTPVYQKQTNNTIDMCTSVAIGTKPYFLEEPTTNISEALGGRDGNKR